MKVKSIYGLENHSFDHNGPDNGVYAFDDFMQAVDAECWVSLGCSANDLPDYPFRDDWETCQEDLAFVAPEDYNRRIQVFSNHVGYTVEDLVSECDIDANPYSQGVDY
jgi:hypothetical protein